MGVVACSQGNGQGMGEVRSEASHAGLLCLGVQVPLWLPICYPNIFNPLWVFLVLLPRKELPPLPVLSLGLQGLQGGSSFLHAFNLHRQFQVPGPPPTWCLLSCNFTPANTLEV